MTRRTPFAFALAAWASLGATTAHAAQATAQLRPCIGAAEAEGLVLVLAPDLIRAVGVTCAPQLPPSALVRQTSGEFLARYQAASDEAWPQAKVAFGKIVGPQAAAIMDSQMARPLIGSLLVPLLTKDIKPKDCAAVDRMLTLLAPLPPRNTAAVMVTILQLSSDARAASGKPSDLPICPFLPPAR